MKQRAKVPNKGFQIFYSKPGTTQWF